VVDQRKVQLIILIHNLKIEPKRCIYKILVRVQSQSNEPKGALDDEKI
jgi:hypothetical protein